jgi:hypothetical protein
MMEHFLAGKHFVQNQPCTPDVTFLVVGFQIDNFRGCVKGCACAFGHQDIYVPCQTKVSNFELLMFVEKNVVRLQISVYLVLMKNNVT